jgi:calcineurin-like phosphoesterase family protein
MNLFFTADCHWGHGNIIRYCNRPFRDEDKISQQMSYNKTSQNLPLYK